VEEIAKAREKAIAVQADVAKKQDIERLFAETTKVFGAPEILVTTRASMSSFHWKMLLRIIFTGCSI
jgi:NAD(P)-dependent dehydrogenase (short-subunit alcohol dehydrogenase family)